MAKNRHDPGGHQLVGGGDGLLAIAIVIGGDQLDLLPEDAAAGVEVGDRNLGASLSYPARPGVGAGQRCPEADPHLGHGRRGGYQGNGEKAE
jgi:hypothetical protein